MNWIKVSRRLPEFTNKRYIVITDDGADFAFFQGNGNWHDDQTIPVKVFYWLDIPYEI